MIALWIASSLAGYVVVFNFIPFPVAAAEQATLIDDAFTLLTLLAIPVFTFVVVALVYSAIVFRVHDEPTEDGLPLRSNGPAIAIWIALTTALTIAIIIHPGITGLNELRAHDGEEVDLVVQVEGRRFAWTVKYPEQKVQSHREMVLPLGAHTRFYVTSFDVLHSFWVPAFRVKIDAVPGITTSVVASPSKTGDFEDDPNFRLQCAELCGVGHAVMRMPVRVVERAEFDEWIAEQSPIN